MPAHQALLAVRAPKLAEYVRKHLNEESVILKREKESKDGKEGDGEKREGLTKSTNSLRDRKTAKEKEEEAESTEGGGEGSEQDKTKEKEEKEKEKEKKEGGREKEKGKSKGKEKEKRERRRVEGGRQSTRSGRRSPSPSLPRHPHSTDSDILMGSLCPSPSLDSLSLSPYSDSSSPSPSTVLLENIRPSVFRCPFLSLLSLSSFIFLFPSSSSSLLPFDELFFFFLQTNP
jgi:hypothetical protein